MKVDLDLGFLSRQVLCLENFCRILVSIGKINWRQNSYDVVNSELQTWYIGDARSSDRNLAGQKLTI